MVVVVVVLGGDEDGRSLVVNTRKREECVAARLQGGCLERKRENLCAMRQTV